MSSHEARDFERARRVETALVLVRWFGVALGAYLVSQSTGVDIPPPPTSTVEAGMWLMGVLAAGNLGVMLALRWASTPARLRVLGLGAFLLDAGVILGLIWAFSYHPLDTTWVVMYVLPLEGALRFRLTGAVAVAVAGLVNELARDVYLGDRFPTHVVSPDTVAFRGGIGLLIAFVAGLTARSLALEARRAFEEAARSREAAEREAAARASLQELDQLKTDFLAVVNHELRTPVAAVRGFLQTIEARFDGLSPEELREFVSTASRRSEELARLVEDLLEVSRVADRMIEVRRVPLDVGALLASVAGTLPEPRRRRVVLDTPSDLPVVDSDPYHVGQIVTRLLDNALKFSTPSDPVWLSAAPDGDGVAIEVRDEGVGIPAERLPFIFERFRQGESALRREADGVGLGLFIVRRLVEELDGRVDVDTEPGLGSTFRVWLPAGTAVAPAAWSANGERLHSAR